MIIWINGTFGAGKTQIAFELNRRIANSFVYDPENAGFFISKNLPKSIQKDDFQDYEMWREFNLSMIKYIEGRYSGTLIIPMTIAEPRYFNEIIGSLKNEGIEVKHFTLMASKETIIRRLNGRGDGINSWPAQQVERCIKNLSNELFSYHIDTEMLNIEETAEKIASMAGVKLLPEKRSSFRRKIDRIIVQLKHVRLFFR